MAPTRFSQRFSALGMLAGLGPIAAIVLAVAATAARADDLEAMAGTWRIVSIDADGQRNDSDDVRKVTVINEPDGDWTLQVDGNTIAKGTSAIDAEASPKQVTLTVTESSDGQNVGRSYKGIYELGEKTRRVCLAMQNDQRPTQFFSAAGSGHVLVSYEKVE